ncbi:hypothetical protein [Botrimarina sp.]|uniref:hypothetical protein n=1 Tax=Botrimarina sp. TaxID=2795802 RepID=UPI0032EF08B7
MLKSITTAALAAAIASPAAAGHFGDLYQHVAQVRGQMALLEAQTSAIFDPLPRGRLLADDIYDELEDLCRDLDRFEADLRRPIQTRGQLRRLERRAEQIEDQACEVYEAVAEALHDARGRHAVHRPVHRHAHRQALRPFPVTRGFPGEPLTAYHGVTTRGVSVNLGGVRLSFGGEPRFVARPVVAHPVVASHLAPGCVSPGQAAVLLAQANDLRQMAKLLHQCACR